MQKGKPRKTRQPMKTKKYEVFEYEGQNTRGILKSTSNEYISEVVLTCESGGSLSCLRCAFVLSFVYDSEMSFFITLTKNY